MKEIWGYSERKKISSSLALLNRSTHVGMDQELGISLRRFDADQSIPNQFGKRIIFFKSSKFPKRMKCERNQNKINKLRTFIAL